MTWKLNTGQNKNPKMLTLKKKNKNINTNVVFIDFLVSLFFSVVKQQKWGWYIY